MNYLTRYGNRLLLAAALLSGSTSAMAEIVEIDFLSTITGNYLSSPLAIGESVSGSIQFDTAELDYYYPMPSSSFASYIGLNTQGAASSTTGAWQQTPPGLDVNIIIFNDYALTPDDVLGIPAHVSSPPIAGDIVDAVGFFVSSNDYTYNPGDDTFSGSEFGVGFTFDSASNVITGLTWSDVDATQLFSAAMYTEFWADQINHDALVWEAVGAAAPVPIPAAAWLFGSGMIFALGFSRRRNGSIQQTS